MIAVLKRNAGHIIGAVLMLVAFVGIHSFMAEHDARIIADTKVEAAAKTIDALKVQQATIAKTTRVEVVHLQERAAEVKTAPEAIAALPEVADAAALDPVALPDAPGKVAVDAVPLYQELNTCKQTTVEFAACTRTLTLQNEVDAQKDVEIAALKKKPGFWHRVKSTAKVLGIGALIGGGAVAYAVTR